MTQEYYKTLQDENKILRGVFQGKDGKRALDIIARRFCLIGMDIYSTDTLAMARHAGQQKVYYDLKKTIEEQGNDRGSITVTTGG